MKAPLFTTLVFLSCASLVSFEAVAQTADNAQTNDRLSHMEHDLMLLQRQVSRGGVTSGSGGDADMPAGGSAQLEVRLSTIEDQLRELRGKVEETDNRNAKLNENFERLKKDVEFRLNELSNNQGAAAPRPQALAPAPQPIADNSPTPLKPLLNQQQTPKNAPFAVAVPPTPAPPAETSAPAAKDETAVFSSPKELYNYAFRLLNQTQYEEAAGVFESFTKKYPKDPLVGNAFYWEGETYYIRRDYVNAADYFRQGFEAMPEGPKAADNLLKLALSLDALSRDKEACLVLQQIGNKFKKSASSVADKAEQEAKRIGCSKT